ncbi:MAG: RDD family protein [Campylobacterota bacterium]|nr:RDD family protein [Campylobacterota bacterium]
MSSTKNEVRYAGFWVRFTASFLDTIFLALPVAIVIYFLSDGNWFDFSQYQQNIAYAMSGNADKALANQPQTSLKWEVLFEVAVLLVTMIFWRRWRGATPGKKFVHIKIVDAVTNKDINNQQAITRSIGYIVSTLALLIGFLMVAFRKDKRGLHDLLAGTVVIYDEDK